MATGNQGITGALFGKIGPVTAYWRNGKNVFRSSTSLVQDRPTPLRLAQREKLRICNTFTRAFNGTGFFNTSFPAYGNTGTGINRATSALLNRAITGSYPNLQLNYQQVLVSKGMLPGAQGARVARKANNTLQFTFTDNSAIGIAAPGDTVILVAYAPELQRAIFTLHGGFRKDKKAILDVTALKGQAVETWIGFLSKDEEHASDSVWVGRVQL